MLDWLDGEAKRWSTDLATVAEVLYKRASVESPALALRIKAEPAVPRPRGYGLLPPLIEDLPPKRVELAVNRYSPEGLSTDFVADRRDAALLARRAETEPLDAAVASFEWLRDRHRFMEAQIAYHREWQAARLRYVDFFAQRSALLPKVERLARLGPGPEAEALRSEILAALGAFRPTPGLRIEVKGGERRLSVKVRTDVDDPAFLDAFERAIDREYNQAPAAKAARLRIEVRFERVPLSGARGSAIDEDAHLARFGDGLVLTTGAGATHARVGRSIHLGADPTRPRELAHEFAHLLGFEDAYLRAIEGTPGPFGAVFVEWSGLQDDLLGSPAHGQVDQRIVDTLIRAYSR